jgi:TonB family protein
MSLPARLLLATLLSCSTPSPTLADTILFEAPPSSSSPAGQPPFALTATDGSGLRLTRLTASAVVEGPLAFTELRLTFENPEPRQLEGRFSITLPAGATISRFAMLLPAGWQEAEVVERRAAQVAYEDFLHRKQDPALLEHAAGNQFGARVFPIPPRGVKEILLSYSQELPREGYRLPLVGLPRMDHLSIRAVAGGRVERMAREGLRPERDLLVQLPAPEEGVASGDLVAARVRVPEPSGGADTHDPAGWILLFDSSGSRALGFETRLRELADLVARLARDEGAGVPLTVACFDQSVQPLYQGPFGGFGARELAAARRHAALGASDLGAALTWAARARGARLVVLTDGVVTAGLEKGALAAAAARLAKSGVERLDLVLSGGIRDETAMVALARGPLPRPGGVFDGERDPDEIARRLRRPLLPELALSVAGAAATWPARRAGLQPGDDLVLYARFADRKPGDTAVILLDGAVRYRQTVALRPVERPLVERSVARARIAALAEDLARLDPDAESDRGRVAALEREIVEVSTGNRVLSDLTALIVLETPNDYARFGFDRRSLTELLVPGERGVELRARAHPIYAGAAARGSGSPDPAPIHRSVRLEEPPVAAPVARDSALGRDAENVMGGLVGAQIGEAYGAGGLGLVGGGGGGGGTGEATIGLGNVAHRRAAEGYEGSGSGYGRGAGGLGGRRAHAPDVVSGQVIVRGLLDKQIIRRVIRSHQNEVRACYDRALLQRPDLGGRVTVQFTLDGHGDVVAAVVQQSTLGAPPLEQCIAAAVRRWKFPSADGGGIVVASYPFVLVPSDEPHGPSPVDHRPPPAVPPPEERTPALTGELATVMDLLARHRPGPALAAASAWHARDPGEVLALIALGEALEAGGDFARAARAYGSIIDLFPSRADLRRFAGERLERIGPAARPLAADTYDKALAQRPDHPSAYRLRAFALLRLGDLAGAFALLERAIARPFPRGRFLGVQEVLRDDLGLAGAAWARAEPKRRTAIVTRLAAAGSSLPSAPSLRFVLTWETDANDVDLHVHDATGAHAFFSQPVLASGGRLYADVTTGYGPECFTIPSAAAFPYHLEAHYYARGPMGYGMGKVEILRHDGRGALTFDERPFVVMNDSAYVRLGEVPDERR